VLQCLVVKLTAMQLPTLAIDFGTKRIGLARSFGTLAEPWHVLNQSDFATTTLLCQHIQKLIQQENIQQIVVGISENESERLTREFILELEKHITVPVFTFDETLTSQTAEAKLRQTSNRRRRPTIDHFAAAEILQEWIDSQ
jgi:putative transcription antitermination factor YqgF